MDVHTSNYTLCSLDPGYGVEKDNYFAEVQFTNDFIKNVVNYVTNLKKKLKDGDADKILDTFANTNQI